MNNFAEDHTILYLDVLRKGTLRDAYFRQCALNYFRMGWGTNGIFAGYCTRCIKQFCDTCTFPPGHSFPTGFAESKKHDPKIN